MGALIPMLLPIIGSLFEKLIPDKDARAKEQAAFLTQLMQLSAQQDADQNKINGVEAASSSVFVAGWRPFIGWVCGGAMAYQYIGLPIAGFIASFYGEHYVTVVLNAPRLDDNLWQLLGAMLGIGGLRTFEKIKGVTK